MLAVTLFVVVITQSPENTACKPGICGSAAMMSAFQRAVERVLGADTSVRVDVVAEDPPDTETLARAPDGAVELSFTPDGQRARLHCYIAREERWLDREITFGESRGSLRSELNERGRLLGFAAATMYAGDAEHEPEVEPAAPSTNATPVALVPAAPIAMPVTKTLGGPRGDRAAPQNAVSPPRRLVEFGALISAGLNGTASGLGASAGLRLGIRGPLWGRLFLAGRTGNIPEAQASTRTALFGGGMAVALLPPTSAVELGLRADGFVSYFDASHLSEDDIAPDLRSRWMAGADLLVEGGFRVTRAAGLTAGAGLEAMLGKTEIYTHHDRVAVVPPFRLVAELGFRTGF